MMHCIVRENIEFEVVRDFARISRVRREEFTCIYLFIVANSVNDFGLLQHDVLEIALK